MEELTRDGEIDFDTTHLKSGYITVYIDGDTGGGKISIHATAGNVRSYVADGGPFDEDNKDDFDLPIKRVVIKGAAHKIIVSLKGAANPNLRVVVI